MGVFQVQNRYTLKPFFTITPEYRNLSKMTNKDIAAFFDNLVKLMELHDENSYRIRSYKNAYLGIRKLPNPVTLLSDDDLARIRGFGPKIIQSIREIIQTHQLFLLNELQQKTPKGVLEMLQIKGLGVKKIKIIWQEMGIETPVELLYACNENQLIKIKGFGAKTQEDIANKIRFFMRHQDQFLWASIEASAKILHTFFKKAIPSGYTISFTGPFREKMPVVKEITLISDAPSSFFAQAYPKLAVQSNQVTGTTKDNIPFKILLTSKDRFGLALFKSTGTDTFQALILSKVDLLLPYPKEEDVFAQANQKTIQPELRWTAQIPSNQIIEQLIRTNDIKGIIHTHSQWSDGHNSIKEMALATQEKGYEYLVITDHSKSAFYANGLSDQRVLAQLQEIDALNKVMPNFRIFKGIESDILSDGSLDYDESILQQFDLVIASIHSNLKMNKATATKRLIKAIEQPYTRILGHLTSRLLLARAGYPIDLDKILDACVANNVAIELNANPYRLDIDYQWIGKLQSKGVSLSINPDAHSVKGIDDVKYGVLAARKAGVIPAQNISSLDQKNFKAYCLSKK